MFTKRQNNLKFLLVTIGAVVVFSLSAFGALGIVHAQTTPEAGLEKVGTAAGLQAGQDIRVIIGNVIKAILGFLGVLALGIVLYAGFLYMTSGGDQEKALKARQWLINGVIGLVIIFSAYAITSFIITKLKAAISGEATEIAGGGGYSDLGIGGIVVFIADSITPNTPASINYPIKVFFNKGVDSSTINKDNVQIIKKGSKGKAIKTLAPNEVIEKNGKGADILSKILVSDDQFTGWDVCQGTSPTQMLGNEGASPMSVVFDISELKGKELSLASYKIENKNSPGGRFTISCGDKNNPAKIVIKEKWASSDKPFTEKVKNSLDIPKKCFEDVADDKLYIQWKRTGSACIKFDYMAFEIVYEDYIGGAAAVDYVFNVSGSNVKFTPSLDCVDTACKGQKCFEKNTDYQVVLKPNVIKSNTGVGLSCAAGSVCLHDFSTNDVCDVAAPTVSFVEPWNGAKVSKDADIDVTVKAVDDGGISYIDFFAADEFQDKAVPASGKNELEFYGYFSWNTEDVVLDAATKKAIKKLKAITEDLDAHLASKEIEVTVLPAYCFDAFGAVLCDKDGTKPECGKCDGSSCSSSSECAGVCVKECQDAEAKTCATNKDCASGVACGGICETPPVITNVAPDTAGPGNYVTIFGKGFLSYKEGASKMFFSGADGEYLEAVVVSCVAGQKSWSNNQIIVKVPEKAGTGPLKIVNYDGKEDSTVDDDGWKGEFEFDPKIKYPGLCAVQLQTCNPAPPNVLCDEGAVGDLVKAIGDNFGHEMADNDMIYFGTVPVGQGADFSWMNKEIKGIQIPVVEPHSYGVTVAKEDSKDFEKKIYSNPVYFQVIPAANLPKIEKISPSPAPFGQMVTISGQYFGQNVGHVEFRRYIDGQPYDWVASLACSGLSWSDSEIIIKVPKEIANTISKIENASAFSKDYQVIIYNSKGLASKPVDFEIINAVPGPGLCWLNPNNGPVGTKFNLSGENFGESKDYYIKFQTADKKATAVTNFGTWSEKLIEKAAVPAGAISGSVYLESNAADALVDKSNSLNFSVGSCKKDSCAEGLSCCADGICKTKCEAVVEYSPSEYMWLVSTGPLPILPQVLERSCLVGVYSQSPSPFKSTEDACPNGMISATFNMLMQQSSLSNNIEVRRCLTVGDKCDFNVCKKGEKDCIVGTVKCLQDGKCVAGNVSQMTNNDFSESNLYVNCKTSNNANCLFGDKDCKCDPATIISQFTLFDALTQLAGKNIVEEMKDLNGQVIGHQLFKNTWYQVVIKGGVVDDEDKLFGGVTSESGKSMASDYAWTFKTKNELCVPENLLLKPLIGLIDYLYGYQKYIVSGQYQCQEIALNNENWVWGVQESYKDKILFAGYACKEPGDEEMCGNSIEGNTIARADIGYYELATTLATTQNLETPVGFPAIIFADAVPADLSLKSVFDKMHKEGGLEVRFAAPKVISYYPNCEAACINSEIGAHFSAQMNMSSLKPENVKLYSCASAECVNLTEITLAAIEISYQETPSSASASTSQINNLKINPDIDLSANTFYRVVITNTVTSASLKPLAGLNYKTENAPPGDCGDWKDNDADGKVDVSGGYIYKGDDDGKLDFVCGCYDTLKPGFISYNKVDDKINCPTGTSLTCLGVEGLKVTVPADLKKIVDDYNYVESDNQCANASDFEIGKSGGFNAFSWVFKTKASSAKCEIDKVEVVPIKYVTEKQGEKIEYWSNPYSAPDECSDKGQLLDPFDYSWAWESSKLAVATITDTKLMVNLPAYCTESCLAKGSAPVEAVCGNGKSEIGEECDDANYVPKDGCSEKCLFEPLANCADANNLNCCGNGEKEVSEKCDAGCVYEAGKCVSSKELYCSIGCLNTGTAAGFVCGNGELEAGEDKDDGNNKDGDGVSSICLNEGAKYNTGNKPTAMCGDGIVGSGEECEATGKYAVTTVTNTKGEVCTTWGTDTNCILSLDNNPYCTDKCVWVGFPACGKCEKIIDCTINNTDCKEGEKVIACLPSDPACGCYKCCGNAQLEDYDGDTIADEECEANALSCKNISSCKNKKDSKSCKSGEADCVCDACTLENAKENVNCVCELKFPEWCSTKCTNLGSSYKYNSYCGDGATGNGEDEQCQDSGATEGAPYQVATTIEPMDFSEEVFIFNLLTKFVEGATKISASTTEKSSTKAGEGDLTYRTNDPDVLAKFCSTELTFISSKSSPTSGMQNVCRNALLSFQFDKKLDVTSGAVALYKVSGTTESLVESTFTATNVGGKTHIIVTPKSLLDATQDYKVKLFNIKNVCGFYFSPWTLTFKTGTAICKIDKIKIEPPEEFAFVPNQIHLFQALAMSGEQAITEVTDAYEWKWNWTADDTSIVNKPVACAMSGNVGMAGSKCDNISGKTNTDNLFVNVTSLAKNGTAAISAETEIEKDVNEPSTKGVITSGSAKLQVLICENIWQPTSLPSNWDTWKITSANLVAPISTHVYEKDYNIGLLYCRDFGKPNNKTDDLPKLKIVQEASVTLAGTCLDTIDNDSNNLKDALETKIFIDFDSVIIDAALPTPYNQKISFVKSGEPVAVILNFNLSEPASDLFTLNVDFLDNNNSLIGKKILIGINNNVPKYFPFNGFLNYGNVAFRVVVNKDKELNTITTTVGFLEDNDSDPKCITKDSYEVLVECNDGIDNDSDGKIDFPADKDCSSAISVSEGTLLAEYLLTREAVETDNSADVIALRIYKNLEFLPPSVWYQKYAPNPADTTGSLALDCQKDEFGEFCYQAAVDGPSVYVGASNLSGNDIYNYIYILSHSQSANEATLNIFNQLAAYLRFNFNLPSAISKVSLIRDTQRIQDMVLTRLFIEQYKQTHNGNAPGLESGTYERGMSFSVWPSWQNELGNTLKQTMPVDPLNHFKWDKPKYVNTGIPCLNESKCPEPVAAYQCVVPEKYCVKCPVGYDAQTCYNSNAQKFFNYYSEPNEHPVYSYQFDPLNTGNKSAYKLDFMLEITCKTYGSGACSVPYTYKITPGF